MVNVNQSGSDIFNDNLKTLFFDNPAPMIIDDNGIFIDVNTAFLKTTGYAKEEVLGKTRTEIGLLDPIQAKVIYQTITEKGSIRNHLIEAKRKDGKIINGQITGLKITYLDRPCILFTMIDMTETVSEIKKREEIELFYDLSPNLIAVTTLEGKFIKFNRNWKELLHYTPDRLTHLCFLDLILDEEKESVSAALIKDHGENLRTSFLKIDGETCWIEWNFKKTEGLIHFNGKDVSLRVLTEKALQEERDLFKTTILSVNEAIIVSDINAKITLMNGLAEEYTGWTFQAAKGMDFDQIFNNINLITREKRPNFVKRTIETDVSLESPPNIGLISKDGTERFISGHSAATHDEHGNITGVVISFVDSTKHKELEYEIEGFLEVNLDMLSVVDKDSYFHRVNKRFEEVLGYTADEIEGKSFFSFIPEEDIAATMEALKDLNNNKSVSGFTNRYRCKDGSLKVLEWHSQPGPGKFIYSSARDVTDRYLTEDALRDQAIHDPMTGLFNRRYFEEKGAEEILRSQRSHQPLSLIMFDIDHFKHINDTYGHPIGDLILKEISQIADVTIRKTDRLFRVGGEEFAILAMDTTLEGAIVVAEKILGKLRNHVHPKVGTYTASFGVCEMSAGESLTSLYARSDEALYQAKHNGRNRVERYVETFDRPIALTQIRWKAEWESGNPQIDIQHRHLVNLSNQILSAPPQEELSILSLIDMLHEDIADHFKEEEKILQNLGYPDVHRHTADHKRLIEKALELRQGYMDHQLKESALYTFIIDDVIVGHMIEEDHKYHAFLKNA